VREADPGVNFGSSIQLWVDASTAKQSFLRVRVSGVRGRRVATARLRLHASTDSAAGSDSGGRVHRISSCTWGELTTTWLNRPAIDGPVNDTAGAVAPGAVVELDLGGIVTADGVYCLALDSASDDGAIYNAREAASGRPEILITLDTPCVRNADCGDGNPCTTDTCEVATGLCRFASVSDGASCAIGLCCAGTCRRPACTTAADCNDGEACTVDACGGSGTCAAACMHNWPPCGGPDGCCGPTCTLASDADCARNVCGDGVCGGNGETCFTCRADCRCQGKDCSNACCGDGVCAGAESPKNCAADCR
jgi:hypothetical protein